MSPQALGQPRLHSVYLHQTYGALISGDKARVLTLAPRPHVTTPSPSPSLYSLLRPAPGSVPPPCLCACCTCSSADSLQSVCCRALARPPSPLTALYLAPPLLHFLQLWVPEHKDACISCCLLAGPSAPSTMCSVLSISPGLPREPITE